MILFFKSVSIFFFFFNLQLVFTGLLYSPPTKQSKAKLEQQQYEKLDSQDGFSVCPSPLSHNSHTHIKMFTMPCVLAYLICGNGGSSDERSDGGLCNHAVGGNTVRRGVEPDKGQTSKKNPWENSNRRCGAQDITLHYNNITTISLSNTHFYFLFCEDSVVIIHFQAPYPGPKS